MKDRLLLYAICVSLAAHIAAVCVIGRTSASKLDVVPKIHVRKSVEIDLLQDQKPIPEKQKPPVQVRQPEQAPKPVYKPQLEAKALPKLIVREPAPEPRPAPVRTIRTTTNSARTVASGRLPGNPGGKINVGSTSDHGDLGGNWNAGKTPVGWVPGNDNGSGKGSGSGEGVGTPDPPKHVDDGPGLRPAPDPPPPPEPRRLTITVCSASGMLPGKFCEHTRSDTFIEGKQPDHTCSQCKEKQPVYVSRIADRAEAVLEKDSPINTGSFPEGLSVRVVISYTVTAEGGVSDVQVTASSGDRSVDREIVRSAGRMRYKPAVQDGVPRSVRKTRSYQINT